MKRFAKFLLVTFGFGVVGFAMSLVPPKTATGAAVAGPIVTVANFPPTLTGAAVPVSITGTPNFNATITNGSAIPVTGTVAVSSLPSVSLGGTVTVGNGVINPVLTQDTDQPARHPFAMTCSTPTGYTGGFASCTLPTTAAGEEVVIDNVSTHTIADNNNGSVGINIDCTSIGGEFPEQIIWLNPQNNFIGTATTVGVYQGSQQLVLRLNPVTQCFANFTTSEGNPLNGLLGIIYLTGYSVSRL